MGINGNRYLAVLATGVVFTLSACGSAPTRAPGISADDQLLLDMTRLHASLELSPAQEPSWERLELATGRLLRQNAMHRNTTKEQLRTSLNNANIDLKPLAEQLNKASELQSSLMHTALNELLALDASLNVAQRQTLRKFLHAEVERSEESDERMNRRACRNDLNFEDRDLDEERERR